MATKFHVKRGDDVVVISGSHKGKSGKVLEILPAKQRVRVAMMKRHMKKSQENPNGSIVEREGSVHVSNLQKKAVFDASKKRVTKVAAQA